VTREQAAHLVAHFSLTARNGMTYSDRAREGIAHLRSIAEDGPPARARTVAPVGALPHVREPDRNEPDVCVHCREPWCELFTDQPADECPTRLRAALNEARRCFRWEQHPNNRHVRRLILGIGPNEIVLGQLLSRYDRVIGHVVLVSAGTWSDERRETREAAAHLCRHLGIAPVPL
jgi:hypothetical protein